MKLREVFKTAWFCLLRGLGLGFHYATMLLTQCETDSTVHKQKPLTLDHKRKKEKNLNKKYLEGEQGE